MDQELPQAGNFHGVCSALDLSVFWKGDMERGSLIIPAHRALFPAIPFNQSTLDSFRASWTLACHSRCVPSAGLSLLVPAEPLRCKQEFQERISLCQQCRSHPIPASPQQELPVPVWPRVLLGSGGGSCARHRMDLTKRVPSLSFQVDPTPFLGLRLSWFFCRAPFSHLQKSLCMLQTVWGSSAGSWALQESDCHHQGKKRSWKCRLVRTIIRVGPNSFLARNHPLSVLTCFPLVHDKTPSLQDTNPSHASGLKCEQKGWIGKKPLGS